MDCSTPDLPVHHQLPELAQAHDHWVGDAIQPSHPLSSPSLPAFNFPSIRVFCNELAICIRWPKYWSFTFSISPSNEYSGLISFSTDWFELAVQGTLKSLLQHHSSKASILLHSDFFMVQISHPYMTTGKTIPLTRQNFGGKVTSLLFNMLSRFVMAFLPRSKHLFLWLQSLSSVILELKKIKSVTVSTVSPSICHEVMGLDPLQCSCLENPRDGGAWWAAVYGVTRSQTRLKWLSSSSSRWDWMFCNSAECLCICMCTYIYIYIYTHVCVCIYTCR